MRSKEVLSEGIKWRICSSGKHHIRVLERPWQMGEMLKQEHQFRRLLIIKNLNSQNIRHSSAWGSVSLVKVPVAGFGPWRELTPWIVPPASHVHHGMDKHNTQQTNKRSFMF